MIKKMLALRGNRGSPSTGNTRPTRGERSTTRKPGVQQFGFPKGSKRNRGVLLKKKTATRRK